MCLSEMTMYHWRTQNPLEVMFSPALPWSFHGSWSCSCGRLKIEGNFIGNWSNWIAKYWWRSSRKHSVMEELHWILAATGEVCVQRSLGQPFLISGELDFYFQKTSVLGSRGRYRSWWEFYAVYGHCFGITWMFVCTQNYKLALIIQFLHFRDVIELLLLLLAKLWGMWF
jgi:hypothetical protein